MLSAMRIDRPVQVFFSRRPQSDADFTAVFPVSRAASDASVASAALRALIAGPTPEEQRQGYFSELGGILTGPSTCGGPDFLLRIDQGFATLQFCRQVTLAGVGQDARVASALTSQPLADAQITWTGSGGRVEAVTSAAGDALLEGVGSAGGTLEARPFRVHHVNPDDFLRRHDTQPASPGNSAAYVAR